jgi:hypothetical protein
MKKLLILLALLCLPLVASSQAQWSRFSELKFGEPPPDTSGVYVRFADGKIYWMDWMGNDYKTHLFKSANASWINLDSAILARHVIGGPNLTLPDTSLAGFFNGDVLFYYYVYLRDSMTIGSQNGNGARLRPLNAIGMQFLNNKGVAVQISQNADAGALTIDSAYITVSRPIHQNPNDTLATMAYARSFVGAGGGLVAADSVSIRNYSNVLYLGKPLGTGQENYVPKWSASAGGPVWRPDSVGTGVAGLVAADSVLIRNYSNALYLKNADSTTLKNSLLKNADSTSIRNYSNALYLKNADSTSIRNYSTSLYAPKASPTFSGTVTTALGAGTVRSSAGGALSATASDTVGLAAALAGKQSAATYLVPSDSTSIRNRSNALYLKNADSTTIRTYSGTLYLKNADSTTLKNALLKNADSTSIRNYSNSLYLKNADSTTLKNALLKNADSTSIRNRSNALYLKNADSTTLKNALLKNADSTSIRNYSTSLYLAKATVRTLFSAGLIDSVKTSDTVFVGWVYPAATIDSVVYSGARSQSLTARLELVDSLYQTAAGTLVDTTTCTIQKTRRAAAVGGGTFTLTAAKILRMVFPVVGTMPKQFNVTVVGH